MDVGDRARFATASGWIRTNEQFFSAVQAQTAADTAIRFFVALSIAFGPARLDPVAAIRG